MLKYLSVLIALIGHQTMAQTSQNDFVIVELFTSQGCSSCPSADRLLDQTVSSNDRVIGLSFHVDYWNYLGWKDPYSSKRYTERQRAYAKEMNLSTIYTPQMVVNGTNEFVGSNASKLNRAIRTETGSSSHSIKIADVEVNPGQTIQFGYTTNVDTKDLLLNVAVTKKEVTNYVPKGENHGRTLKHRNVVVDFRSYDAKSNDTISIDLEKSLDLSDALLVIYLQDKNSLKILTSDLTSIK